eukprot:4151538-Amphidinium_carterae.1
MRRSQRIVQTQHKLHRKLNMHSTNDVFLISAGSQFLKQWLGSRDLLEKHVGTSPRYPPDVHHKREKYIEWIRSDSA